MVINFNSPIIFHRNVDENNNPISESIPSENITVFHSKSYLNQIPDKYYRVTINNIADMVEIDINEDITSENQYKVPYGSDRLIYFHPNKEGQVINVSYYGIGYTFIDSDNICTKKDDEGNVIQTLEDYLNSIKEIIGELDIAGLKILDLYATLSALETAHPTGSTGDAYAVGTEASNVIYVWSTTLSDWINIGSIKGDTGATGDTGAKGDTGDTPDITIGTITTVSNTTPASATITGTTPNLTLNMSIPKGADGAGSGDMVKADFATNAKVMDGYVDKAILADGATTLTGLTSSVAELNYVDGVTSNIQTQFSGKLATTLKGAVNGLAELDSSGKVPSAQLPSFVDDVLEVELKTSLPASGESGKIYVVYGDTTENNGSYRWTGSVYTHIDNPLSYATQLEAETGTENTKVMTALRVFQSIAKWITTTAIGTLGTLSNTTITSSDNVKSALEKLQGQVTASANQIMEIAVSDEATAITTGTAKITFRAPFAMTLYQVPRASLNIASTSGNMAIDINVGGSSIFSTVLTIDANEKTSTTAATAAVLSTTTIVDDAEITIDIDTAGTGAKGLKVVLYYRRT